MESGDNLEYERRSREARREGLFYVAILVASVLIGLALRAWEPW